MRETPRACGPARTAAVAALVALAASCAGGAGVDLEHRTPPDGWKQALLRERAERDEDFRLDPDTPIHPDDRATFRGLEYWAPDPAYYFVGPIHAYEHPERFTILSTAGAERPAERWGWVRFDLRGKTCVLQVYRLLDIDAPDPVSALFLPFTDGTTGKETYPAGRYVELSLAPDGSYVLDFNVAHNPLCAYGMPERYACPVTPPENRLPVRVEAGERGYRERHG